MLNRFELKYWLYCLMVMATAVSCVPNKKMIYLQKEEVDTDTLTLYNYERLDYKLQKNDIIDVQIRSLNPEVNELFGSGGGGSSQVAAQAGVQSGGDLYYMSGYTIDKNGVIDLPVIGEVNVEGKSIPEIKTILKEKAEQYFSKYHLTVKLGGIRFSALGEFNLPGKYVILQNQATIFEAVALAGDLSMVANRQNVALIRQYPDGTKVHRVNLLDDSLIKSPYYFIQPNDVVYVEPLPQKSFGLGVTGAQTISTAVSIVATSLALILAIQGLNN